MGEALLKSQQDKSIDEFDFDANDSLSAIMLLGALLIAVPYIFLVIFFLILLF